MKWIIILLIELLLLLLLIIIIIIIIIIVIIIIIIKHVTITIMSITWVYTLCVPCIFSHARLQFSGRFRSLLLWRLSIASYLPLYIDSTQALEATYWFRLSSRSSSKLLYIQSPLRLLATGNPGRPPQLSTAPELWVSGFEFSVAWRPETIMTNRVGEPKDGFLDFGTAPELALNISDYNNDNSYIALYSEGTHKHMKNE